MEFDDIGIAAYREQALQWGEHFRKSALGICDLANKYRKHDDCMFRSIHYGGFNFCICLSWDDGGEDWLIRFPLPGCSMFMDNKVLNEASLMKYIADNTNIPVPRVIVYGKAEDSTTGLGPFIIMTWVEGTPMSEILRKKTQEEENDDYVLNLDIDEKALETLYGQMADVLLELWKLDFDRIGTLRLDESGKPSIKESPLTQETNELIRTGNVHNCVPSGVYHSSVDYIFSLLENAEDKSGETAE